VKMLFSIAVTAASLNVCPNQTQNPDLTQQITGAAVVSGWSHSCHFKDDSGLFFLYFRSGLNSSENVLRRKTVGSNVV
ncbi:hypothetical protein, partial [Prochlorothrix hollandica]|uniref:hypothetical protein n=1 Tax=Prochlorothrix hollandica TaxID=1223 RepID=UPI003341479E